MTCTNKCSIIGQMESVVSQLAHKEPRIREKVDDIMGGKVLKMEWLERFDAAVAEGEARGRAEGEAERKKLEARIRVLEEELKNAKAAMV